MKDPDVLETEYYHDSHGKPIQSVQYLGNCLTRNIYFILKDRVDNPYLLKSAYIDDFSMNLVTDSTSTIINIQNNDIKNPACYVTEHNKIGLINDGLQAIKYIEMLLDQGEIVFVNTLMKQVPFYKSFINNAAQDPYEVADYHYFLILGHTDHEFYYLDNHVNYGKKHRPYPGNKSIGVDSKSNFIHAFDLQFNCFTLMPDYSELAGLNSRIPYVIGQSIENYKSVGIGCEEDQTVYFGRSMIHKFIDVYTGGQIHLNDRIPNREHTVYSLSNTVFNRNNDRKRVLLMFLENLPAGPSKQKLIDNIENNLVKWEIVKNKLTKKYFQNAFGYDAKIRHYLENALEAENSLFQTLEDEWDWIYTYLVFK